MTKPKSLGKRSLQFEAVEGRESPTPLFPVSSDLMGDTMETGPQETSSFGGEDTIGGGDGDTTVGGGNGGD